MNLNLNLNDDDNLTIKLCSFLKCKWKNNEKNVQQSKSKYGNAFTLQSMLLDDGLNSNLNV